MLVSDDEDLELEDLEFEEHKDEQGELLKPKVIELSLMV